MRDADSTRHWIDQLTDEDVMFLKRFVLASGSLKGLAAAYGISYPTVRLRLDRLIQKVNLLDDHTITSDFERLLRLLYADGKLDMATLRAMLSAHRKEMEGTDETVSDHP